MPIGVAITLGIIFALVGAILSVVLITPENKRATLNKFFVFVHDLFNFKFLLLEKVLKFLYIFSTLSCIAIGFFMLFSGVQYGGYYYSHYESFALQGLAVMILGPIVVRIIYEGAMMGILLVKNVIQINNKLKSDADENPVTNNPIFVNSEPETPAEPAPVSDAPTRRFCTQCGAPYEEGQNACTQCGKVLK